MTDSEMTDAEIKQQVADWQRRNALATEYLYQRVQDLCLDYVEAPMEPEDRINAMLVCIATLAEVIND